MDQRKVVDRSGRSPTTSLRPFSPQILPIGLRLSGLGAKVLLLVEQLVQVGVDHIICEIRPNPWIVSAVISPARNGAMLAHAAFAAGLIEMPAVAVFGLSDQIGGFEVPHDNPFSDVL